MSPKYPLQPDYAFPAGDTLIETLACLRLTQKELAVRMGCPLETINHIIKGSAHIMPVTALQLEKFTGVPASFWITTESNYRQHLARLAEEKQQRKYVDGCAAEPF